MSSSLEQIRRVFENNLGISFVIPIKKKTYVMGTHYNRPAVAILMSTHNICFMENYRKLSFNYHQIPSLPVLLLLGGNLLSG